MGEIEITDDMVPVERKAFMGQWGNLLPAGLDADKRFPLIAAALTAVAAMTEASVIAAEGFEPAGWQRREKHPAAPGSAGAWEWCDRGEALDPRVRSPRHDYREVFAIRALPRKG